MIICGWQVVTIQICRSNATVIICWQFFICKLPKLSEIADIYIYILTKTITIMNKVLSFLILIILIISLSEGKAYSNKDEVKKTLGTGWTIHWGKEINGDDYSSFLVAVAASAACKPVCYGEADPVKIWWNKFWFDQYRGISKGLSVAASAELQRILIESLWKKKIIQKNNIQYQAGIASFRHWETWKTDEPHSYECWWEALGIKTKGICWTTRTVEHRRDLLNTHQAYIRYRRI